MTGGKATIDAATIVKGDCQKCGARRVDQQLGLEATPEDYVARLVEVFREARRVLKADGTLWLNLGDSYAGGQNSGSTPEMLTDKQRSNAGCRYERRVAPLGLKSKDLVGIPWRVALALQADGWYLRSDIIWHKPNPMPESVKDRPTRSHEYIFLMAKSQSYHYNAEAIAERSVSDHGSGNGFKRDGRLSYMDAEGPRGSDVPWKPRSKRAEVFPGQSVGTHRPDRTEDDWDINVRNKRSVWTINTAPFPEAHFATFPEDLVTPCVLAGARPGDTVLDPFAGAATVAVVARRNGCKFIGIELNPEYCAMAVRRLSQDVLDLYSNESESA